MKKRQRKLISEAAHCVKNGKNQDEVNSDMVVAVRRVFDADNKGFIYTADLRFIILNMDCSIPREELNELIISTNLNQDKKISLQEFLSLLMPIKEK